MTTRGRLAVSLMAVAAVVLLPATASADPNIEVAPGSAKGQAIETQSDGGVLIISETETSKDDARATALSLFGTELYGYKDGHYTGALSGLGAVLGPLNEALCPAGPAAPGQTCIAVLRVKTSEVEGETGSSRSASSVILGVNASDEGINVLGSDATSQHVNGRCSDFARAYWIAPKSQFGFNEIDDELIKQRLSFNQPCEEETGV